MTKISIVVPVYNEINTIEEVLNTLRELPFPEKVSKEIIIVNDKSNDGTDKILSKYSKIKGFVILNNKKNMGKTFTVQRGILASTGELVVTQDADNEYDPYDLIKMVIIMLNDPNLDAIYGNRFNRRNRNKGMNFIGNRVLSAISNFFTIHRGLYVRDMEVCYKMIRGDLFRAIAKTFQSERFGLEPETTAKLAIFGAKVINVDIHYFPRNMQEGKKLHAFKDGLQAIEQIVKNNIQSNLNLGLHSTEISNISGK